MLRVAAAPHSLAPTPLRAACHAPARGTASRCAAQTLCRPPCRRSRCGAACEEEPSISLDRGMAGGATAGREVGGVMGRVGAFDGPAAQSPTFAHVCPSCARASALRERPSYLSGGALFLAVERARSLSRAEAASHGPSVMACRDPAPAQTPRYRGASAHAVHAAADSRNPPGVGLCRQVPAIHLRPSLCQSRWWHLCCDSAPECN